VECFKARTPNKQLKKLKEVQKNREFVSAGVGTELDFGRNFGAGSWGQASWEFCSDRKVGRRLSGAGETRYEVIPITHLEGGKDFAGRGGVAWGCPNSPSRIAKSDWDQIWDRRGGTKLPSKPLFLPRLTQIRPRAKIQLSCVFAALSSGCYITKYLVPVRCYQGKSVQCSSTGQGPVSSTM